MISVKISFVLFSLPKVEISLLEHLNLQTPHITQYSVKRRMEIMELSLNQHNEFVCTSLFCNIIVEPCFGWEGIV